MDISAKYALSVQKHQRINEAVVVATLEHLLHGDERTEDLENW